MGIEDYLSELRDQIRDRYAKVYVTEEIRTHIEEQAEAYQKSGLDSKEAYSKAVEDMGDPVIVGADLDKIHRPHMEWRFFGYILFISILSIGLQCLINAGIGTQPGAGGIHNISRMIILKVFIGMIAMLAVYRIDYTVLIGRSRLIGGSYLALITLIFGVFGYMINDTNMRFGFGPVSVSVKALVLLYLPIFAGILYEYREKGISAILKILLWMLAPVCSLFIIGYFSPPVALFMIVSEMVLLFIALHKNWYRVSRKTVYCAFAAMSAAFLGLSAAGLIHVWSLNGYQKVRLESWMAHFGIGNFVSDDTGVNFINSRLSEVFAYSGLLGRNEEAVKIMSELPGFRDDLIIGSIAANCGKIAAAGIIICLFVLAAYIFRISLKQRNNLGHIVGCACGVTIALQSVSNIMIVFGILPLTDSVLPLFTYGLSDCIVDYILLGLILSIYRYKDIRKERLSFLTKEMG